MTFFETQYVSVQNDYHQINWRCESSMRYAYTIVVDITEFGVLRFRVRHGVREKQCQTDSYQQHVMLILEVIGPTGSIIRKLSGKIIYSAVKQDHHTLNMQLHYLVIYCYHYACFRLSLFSDINVSQGSAATLAWCGGIFNANFVANS